MESNVGPFHDDLIRMILKPIWIKQLKNLFP